MKTLNALAIICLSASAATSTFASSSSAKNNDYDSNYYKEEGSILFKFKGAAIAAKGKLKGLPKSNAARPTNVPALVSNGYGVDGSASVFLAPNIAAEFDLGLYGYKTSASALNAISANYGNNSSNKKKNVYAIPMALLFQYHIAPYGAIRPYVGAGYQYTYMLSKAAQFTIENGHGYALQAGVDFAMTDDTVISLDVKRYQLTPKVKFKKSFLGTSTDMSAKAKINPVIISLGMGWKF